MSWQIGMFRDEDLGGDVPLQVEIDAELYSRHGEDSGAAAVGARHHDALVASGRSASRFISATTGQTHDLTCLCHLGLCRCHDDVSISVPRALDAGVARVAAERHDARSGAYVLAAPTTYTLSKSRGGQTTRVLRQGAETRRTPLPGDAATATAFGLRTHRPGALPMAETLSLALTGLTPNNPIPSIYAEGSKFARTQTSDLGPQVRLILAQGSSAGSITVDTQVQQISGETTPSPTRAQAARAPDGALLLPGTTRSARSGCAAHGSHRGDCDREVDLRHHGGSVRRVRDRHLRRDLFVRARHG